jgi:flagellar P-ring protein precursor FlgI
MRRRLIYRVLIATCWFMAAVSSSSPARADKVKDLCDVMGARENQLIGYGVVTGLNGTGDDVSAPFAAQSMQALLRRIGVQVDSRQLRLRNVAAVIVTADIPAFSRSGTRIDVTASSMGNARSLRGGILIQTPLRGANRKTYAVAQGALVLGGFSAKGSSGSSVTENTTTTARIPNGALVERTIPTKVTKDGKLTLALRTPDFTMAARITKALNEKLGKGKAKALDGGAIEVKIAERTSPVTLIAKIGEVEVDPATHSRVVINERTGTIVAGGDVKLLPVAIAQGGITISVRETPQVSQPGAFAEGDTRVVPESEVETEEQAPPSMTYVDGAASLADVAQALSTFGVTPRELASILQALKASGALRAEVIVQ